jgi:hypothetical protein
MYVCILGKWGSGIKKFNEIGGFEVKKLWGSMGKW